MTAEFPETDAALVERIRAGDRSAFRELVRRYENLAYRLALRFTASSEEAQEVLQETFLSVHRKLDAFRSESAFSTWLYRVTVNTALMHLRRHRSALEEVPMEELEPALSRLQTDWSDLADSSTVRHELARVIQGAVDELPDKYRAVFLLRDVEDLSTEEVADVLEINVTTVKTRLHRARLYLREKLAAYQEAA